VFLYLLAVPLKDHLEKEGYGSGEEHEGASARRRQTTGDHLWPEHEGVWSWGESPIRSRSKLPRCA
jgi:hypothetical protein